MPEPVSILKKVAYSIIGVILFIILLVLLIKWNPFGLFGSSSDNTVNTGPQEVVVSVDDEPEWIKLEDEANSVYEKGNEIMKKRDAEFEKEVRKAAPVIEAFDRKYGSTLAKIDTCLECPEPPKKKEKVKIVYRDRPVAPKEIVPPVVSYSDPTPPPPTTQMSLSDVSGTELDGLQWPSTEYAFIYEIDNAAEVWGDPMSWARPGKKPVGGKVISPAVRNEVIKVNGLRKDGVTYLDRGKIRVSLYRNRQHLQTITLDENNVLMGYRDGVAYYNFVHGFSGDRIYGLIPVASDGTEIEGFEEEH
ncbi:MAG: hypothetical protein NUV82_00300 [Candidatus Komeilibacteria bacterium]|nr:hypothetical protein [Candidatus Komeilibacteria bacterium]